MSENYVSTANDPVITPFSDDSEEVRDDELISDSEPANLSPAERATRAEKKSARIKAKLDEGRQSKAENERLRTQLAEQNTRLARLEGAVVAQQRPQEPQGDPYAARLAAVRARQSEAYNAAQAEITAKTFDDKRADHYAKIAADIEDEKMSINAERLLARQMPAIRQEQAQQVYVQKYAEVYKPENRRAFQYAQGRYQQRTALGEPETAEMVDEIMNETMTQFRLGAKKAPTATEKDRLSGRGTASSGGPGSGAAAGGIQMTPALRKMAISLHAGEMNAKGQAMTEEEAVQKWINSVGKELRKNKVL